MTLAWPTLADEAPREIWVNGLKLSTEEILLMEDVVGVRLRDGAYLYDPMAGTLRAVGMSSVPARPPAFKDSAA